MPRQTPGPAHDHLRHQTTAAASTAVLDGRHPGHWHLHHIMLPDGPGDFTPYQVPGYIEQDLRPFTEWLDALAAVLTPDYAQAIAQPGAEAGQ